jgi:prepilin-type processing-associated H-X9-DG protein
MNRIILSASLVLFLTVCASAHAGSGSGDSPVGLIDTRGPVFSSLSVDVSVATPGDTVLITFSVSEPLATNPLVRVNLGLASFVSEIGGVYTYSYTVGTSAPGGPANISVEGADALGNPGTISASDLLTLEGTSLPVHAGLVFLALLAALVVALRRTPRASGALLVAALLLTPAAVAQDPTVSNVAFVQQPAVSGGTEIVITYDLNAPTDPCYITVSLSKDTGADGFPFPVTSVTGYIDNVPTGTGYTIVWDVAADYPNEYIPQAQIRVTADTSDTRDYSPWLTFFPGHIWGNSAKCQNNLKQMGINLRVFASDSPGEYWPRLSSDPGNLMLRKDEVFPEFLINPDILLCPGLPDEDPQPHFTDEHYVYLGYLVTNDQDALAFANAYAAEVAAGGDFSDNLAVTTSYGDTLFRLREGVVRFLITDINDPDNPTEADIPVMFDWPDNHQQGWGGNVLYMDGHVEFVLYGEFPMTDTTIAAFAGLAGYTPPTEWRAAQIFPYTAENDPHAFVAHCSNNFPQLWLPCKMFANQSPGAIWPRLSGEAGRLMFREDELYPEYLDNPTKLVCPGAAEIDPAPHFDDQHYLYLGYVLLNDEDVTAFAGAYAAEVAAGGDFTGDLAAATSYAAGDTLLRLRDGVERMLTTDINIPSEIGAHQIPVMMEWPGNHEGLLGGHVLYLDGHREWHDYPGEWPMTEATVSTLSALASWTPTTAWAEPNPVYLLENDPYDFASECLGNCKQLGVVGKMFANESPGGVWPRLSGEPGKLMMAQADIFPEYLIDSDAAICPGPEKIVPEPFLDDQHYTYFGYLLTNDADVTAFAGAYAAEVTAGGDFSGDLTATASYGDTIYRLRDGIESILVTDINNPADGFLPPYRIPVLMEWPGNHEGQSGGHVLYLDGHAEWHDYPGEFPMTPTTVSTLGALASWTPATAWAAKDFTWYDDPHKQALCAYNMQYMGYSFKTFANQAQGEYFPQLSNLPTTLMFRTEWLVPYSLNDLRRLNCPGSADIDHVPVADDHCYFYLGYILMNDDDVSAFAGAHAAELAAGGDFSEDLPATASYGDGDVLLRVREGVERFFISDIVTPPPATDVIGQFRIPVMIEWPDNHGDLRGGNVLYMDGHTEWLAYPGEFPMTEAAMAIFTSLAGRGPIE